MAPGDVFGTRKEAWRRNTHNVKSTLLGSVPPGCEQQGTVLPQAQETPSAQGPQPHLAPWGAAPRPRRYSVASALLGRGSIPSAWYSPTSERDSTLLLSPSPSLSLFPPHTSAPPFPVVHHRATWIEHVWPARLPARPPTSPPHSTEPPASSGEHRGRTRRSNPSRWNTSTLFVSLSPPKRAHWVPR